ncbi:P-loop containing nucleoside triphosphate hydrolase protein, partial [Chytriomyces cf. hyalinus JEL632]
MTLQLLKSCLRRIPICRQCPPSAKTIRTLSTLAADPPLSQYAQLNSQLHQFAQPVQSPPHLPRHIASLDNSRFLSLSPAQKELLNLMCEGKSVYFTGKAGAGKTEVLSRFIHFRRSDPFMALKTLITAPTGIAASHISGSTLHSRFGLKPSPIPKHNSAQELVKRANADINLLSRYILTDTLVIDEVSMVNKRDFEAISVAMGLLKSDFLTCQKVVRYLTKKAEKRAKAQAKKEASRSLESTCKVTPGHSLLSELKETATDLESWNFQLDPRTFFDKDAASKPFGGAQVVLSGDFYQLPPVERESEALVQYRQFVSKQFQGKDLEWHLSPYVFTGSEWGKLVRSGMKMVMLEKSFRHGDTDFTNFLDRLRVGEWDDDMIGLLQPRILSDDSHPEVQPIKLCAYRATAQDYNSENLRKIQSPQVDFYSHDHVVEIEQLAPILKSLSESRNPYADSAISIDGSTESHESLLDAHSLDFTSLPVPALLNLRIGAQVVLSKNQRIGSGLVNGTRGKVVDFHE